MVEQPELFLEQERAVEPLVGGRDLGQPRELLFALALRRLEQRPAGVLDPAAARSLALAVLVPLGAAHIVDRSARELAHVERVEHDLRAEPLVGLGDRLDRVLIAGRHVDRDRADRVAPVAEQLEERLQRLGVAAGLSPHDRPALVVGDAGQVALTAAVGDLVHADQDEPVEAGLAEVVGDDAGDDVADRVPRDPHQPGDRRLGHLLREKRDDVLEVAGVRSARPGPADRLIPDAAVGAAQPAQFAFEQAAVGAEIEVPPPFGAVVGDLEMPAGLPALRTDSTSALGQLERDDHPLGVEADVDHGRPPAKAEHPLECGRDAHVALLREPLDFEHPAACLEGRQRVTQNRAARERQVAEPVRPPQARAAEARTRGRTRQVQGLRALDPPGPLRFRRQSSPGYPPGTRRDSPPNGEETPKKGTAIRFGSKEGIVSDPLGTAPHMGPDPSVTPLGPVSA